MPTLTVLDALSQHAPSSGAAAGRVVVDVPHPSSAARAKFARRGPFPVAALRWEPDHRPPAPASLSFSVVEHVGWLAPDATGVDPTGVVKQVSFLHKSADVGIDEFRSRYRHHVEVARRHMPTLWQYVQHDVLHVDGDEPSAVSAANGIVAVSVLWFRSTADFLERYFASPQDEAEFRSQEGFLDLSKAFTFVAAVQPGVSPTARP